MVLVAVLENGCDEDELAAKLGRVLDLNRQTSGLERKNSPACGFATVLPVQNNLQ
jgi:hypothetical protein